MKLKKPDIHGYGIELEESRYLAHCENIARILADKNGWGEVSTRLDMYIQITGAELKRDKSS